MAKGRGWHSRSIFANRSKGLRKRTAYSHARHDALHLAGRLPGKFFSSSLLLLTSGRSNLPDGEQQRGCAPRP
jgi:hypothetical protein